MKHLKEYSLFENLDRKHFDMELDPQQKEVLDYIEDICLDLTDEGFNISIHDAIEQPSLKLSGANMCIYIRSGKNMDANYKLADVSELIERLKGYLGESFLAVYFLTTKWVTPHEYERNMRETLLAKGFYTTNNIYSTMISFNI